MEAFGAMQVLDKAGLSEVYMPKVEVGGKSTLKEAHKLALGEMRVRAAPWSVLLDDAIMQTVLNNVYKFKPGDERKHGDTCGATEATSAFERVQRAYVQFVLS